MLLCKFILRLRKNVTKFVFIADPITLPYPNSSILGTVIIFVLGIPNYRTFTVPDIWVFLFFLSLQFPKDLFKDNVTDEISHEDNGLPDKVI